jgi:hypothetical protein
MELLIAKGVFLLVAVGALVVIVKNLRAMMKNKFWAEKSNQQKI